MLPKAGPRLYELLPQFAGTIDLWPDHLERIRAMDFDVVYLNPFHETGPSGNPYAIKEHHGLAARFRPRSSNLDDDTLIFRFVARARALGLRVMVDSVLTHTSGDAALLARHPDWFIHNAKFAGPEPDDSAVLDWFGPHQEALADYFQTLVRYYVSLGITGFRCPASWMVPPKIWAKLIAQTREVAPESFFCAEALGRPEEELDALRGVGFDYIFNSVRWWDAKSPWFLSQELLLQSIAPTIGFPESHDTRRGSDIPHDSVDDRQRRAAAYRKHYLLAASFSAGVMMPIGYEWMAEGTLDSATLAYFTNENSPLDISGYIAEVNRLKGRVPALSEEGPIDALAHPFDAVQGFARWNADRSDLVFIVVNTDDMHSFTIDLDWLLASLVDWVDLEDVTPGVAAVSIDAPELHLLPSEIRILRAHLALVESEDDSPEISLSERGASPPPRVVIEAIEPRIDGGQFPIKRVVGDRLKVAADIFRDGHDEIAAAIRMREAGAKQWRLVPMRFYDNDRWRGSIAINQQGPFDYTVEAWTDHFASWRIEVRKKIQAGQRVALELAEGRDLVVHALARAVRGGRARVQQRLRVTLDSLERFFSAQPIDEKASADLLLSRFVAHAVGAVPDKSDRAIFAPLLPGVADRPQARFSSWYEIFPRNQGADGSRSATFADCARRLPAIRELGFDVLYMTPIHPIGRVNRKGRNNSLVAGPDDPGSPYAIGNALGGHAAIDPGLGTLADFRLFRDAVADHGMELALDFAIQCAPDHPWLTENPTWFRRRPDGTIKYAENPPKKYEDIVNVDFDNPDWFALWQALLDVVRFWVAEGVKIFRVDNPHTKPVPFWQWLIAEVKRTDPDVLFLAEAFTRPKMMGRLAKIGFTQSYSYFTWRNTKTELTEYLTELTTSPSQDYMQPNFFPNTPDILPVFLQNGGRAGFQIRLVLAATLSPSYGIYSGFELCEAQAVPKREEYANSEKYQFMAWDWDRPGHIKDDIVRLNRLRRESASLQAFTNLQFLDASHPNVLFYVKTSPDGRDRVFVAVNLDPFAAASAELSFPLEAMGLDEDQAFETNELFSGERRRWRGRRQWVTLDPVVHPAMVMSHRAATGAASW